MSTDVHLDYETKSVLDLDVVGLSNYLDHQSTQVLMAAYAEGDHKPKLWEPHLQPKMPAELREAIEDPFVTIHGWNVPFEIGVTNKVLGFRKPTNEWRDTMVQARYMSLPGKLGAAGKILGLDEDEAKDKAGSRLIRLFCEPAIPATEGGLFGDSPAMFNNWSTHPKEWEEFGVYCCQDVIAERIQGKKMAKYPLPEHEWDTWCLDRKINETGWPVDLSVVRGAGVIVLREMEKLTKRLREITHLDNPNSVEQLMSWLPSQGYTFTGLDKNFVSRAMNGECDLTEAAKEALTIRKQTSKSSVKKYNVITNQVSPNGRLRNQYTFMGAARTHRWAAHGANVGNLPKPEKNVEHRLELAVELVQKMDYDAILKEFGNPLGVVSSTIRPAFRAPEGYKFVVCDLSAIEARGLGYLCRCESILNVFRLGHDPYLDFATKMYKQTYEELEAEYKAGNKTKRTTAKPGQLGCGYKLGPGKESVDEAGNKTWDGLMGYSRAMGIEMTQAEAELAVKAFRSSYPEVKKSWRDFEQAAVYAIRHPGKIVGVGSALTERDRSYFLSKGWNPDLPPIISFKCNSDKVLEMILPSGRSLHYIDPRITEEDAVWEGRAYKKTIITYYGKEMNSPSWGQVSTHGGKLLENADQSISRDVLVNGMKKADAVGFQIVGHTYDEIVTLVRVNSHLGVKQLEECMIDRLGWCTPEEFPLGASGFEDFVYRKD